MLLTLLFAFVAGIVTILSPCILPILPIILSGVVGEKVDKQKPYGIVTGFVLSFTFFILFLSSIVSITNIPADTMRNVSIVIIFAFGLSYLLPSFQKIIEQLFTIFARFTPNTTNKNGFLGGTVIGFSLGLLWTPCVGPILASVISLAISGVVTFNAFLITLFYSIGTAIPMLVIILTGRRFTERIGNAEKIQKVFGVIMILMSVAIYFNLDRNFQTYILKTFPNYGTNLTKFEENADINMNSTSIVSPKIIVGGEWFNTETPLQIDELKGKVVLIDFWTYTCINCQRTLPYLAGWHEKYEDDGLIVIGVHSPEFEFEKKASNVQKALKDFGIKYPVVQDNEFKTWKSFNNHYWPAKYIFDKNGKLVYSHFGEGKYNETEEVIQELLGKEDVVNNIEYPNNSKTPETYLGTLRSNNNKKLKLIGDWKYSLEYVNPQKNAELIYSFDAKNVFLVMKPNGVEGSVEVYLDQKYQSTISVDSDSLYTLLELPEPGKHELKLKFLDNNIEVYAFTFG